MSNINVTGQQAYFNEDAKFFKDVYIYGTLKIPGDVEVDGIATFNGPAFFSNNVEIKDLTVTEYFRVGINGEVITATSITGNVGIGSTQPQQRLDVGGSIKIDKNIYDSINVPGRNGYQLSRDDNGIRWIPFIADGASAGVGFGTIVGLSTYSEGIFILNEGVPLYPE